MASIVRLTNTHTTSSVTVDARIDSHRQIHEVIPANGHVDLSTVSVEEMNRVKVQGLLSSYITVTVVDDGSAVSDITALPTEADIRLRTGFPELNIISARTLSISGIPATHTFTGTSLMNGGAKASAVFGSGTSAVTVTANRPGTNGNLITVILQTGSGEAISVSGSTPAGEDSTARTITITSNDGTSTGNSIATLINGDATAKLLIHGAGGGSGTSLEYATKVLDGGTGSGFKVYVAGIEQNINALVTDTTLPMQTRSLTGTANNGGANAVVVTNGTKTFPFAVAIAT